ncbi:acetyl-CoA C-acetyltransferase [Nakamurella deserti]|uniref:acetyl-CoA C-acetyltransferase n=1 Tax=Nakamurella deserti TaxID=2164074 RepID=UPI000DBE2AC3|nr:acetyl-CoA C-acetyltransferase [Nakamurella deserti]
MTAPSPSVILAGARTPIGKYRGGLSSLTAADLGTAAIRAALERAGVDAAAVDYVIMGQVVAAGTGQNPARIAAVNAGIPMSTAAITINKVCLSGVDSIVLADQLVRSGDYDVVVAGGMESMSQAPHVLPSVLTYGDVAMHDALERDGLWDYFSDKSMGELTEDANDTYQVSRADQDEFAATSHRRAALAWKEGRFDAEVVPVQVPQRRGEPITVSHDEGVRPDTTVETLSRLKPTFRKDGTITAGSASPISDGAAAVVVTSRAYAEQHGLSWLAEIGAHATVAGPDSTLQLQPSNAIAKACERQGVVPTDLTAIEINEAFAAVGIASTRALGVDPERVNVDGGAIAVGHPLGASGTRLVLHLAHALKEQGGGLGAAALCGGGGQGEALILSVG